MISIECYEGLPLNYESFLIERYNSYMTTCRYIEIYNSNYDLNYMLVKEDNQLVELIIFGNKKDTSTCFNSLVDIDQNIISECLKKIFEIHNSIKKIKIVASYNNYLLRNSFLISEFNDHIIKLPSTMNDYYSELGRSTRQRLRNRKVKLLKDYPGVNFVTKFGIEIEERMIEKIIQLNYYRMKLKGKIPGKDNTFKNNIYKYSQYYGCVSYIEVDNEIIAGSISIILNNRIFGLVSAHDNNFNQYNLGEACIFFVIETAIEKGLSAFHFLWGESELKDRLLAKPKLLFSYVIYRSNTLDYFVGKLNALFIRKLLVIKQSNFTKPIRNVIKNYRSRSWKK